MNKEFMDMLSKGVEARPEKLELKKLIGFYFVSVDSLIKYDPDYSKLFEKNKELLSAFINSLTATMMATMLTNLGTEAERNAWVEKLKATKELSFASTSKDAKEILSTILVGKA